MQIFSVPPLGDARVPNDVVQTDVAAGLHTFCWKEESHTRHALHSIPSIVQN